MAEREAGERIPLPQYLDPVIALPRIEALTTTARTTWLVLIGFLAFIGLTLLSVRDVDFFSVTATTDLPIVNIAIPTDVFFATAAWLAAILHTYLHVFLLKLWDALAEAPNGLDRLPLADRVFPWLVNDWALRRRHDKATTRRPMDWLADSVTALVIWLATPLLLAGFWWRSMPAHSVWLTLIIAGALATAALASLSGFDHARWRLGRPGLAMTDNNRSQRLPSWWAGVTVPMLLLVVFSIGRTEGQLGPVDLSGIGLAPIDLVEVEIAQRPADWRDWEIARRRFHVQWCAANGLPLQACDHHVPEAEAHARKVWCEDNDVNAGNCRTRFVTLDEVFAEEWREERRAAIANFIKPDLARRDLRGASASGAFLAGVFLSWARMERVDLSAANLEEAILWGAHLEGADLEDAHLEGADLRGAHLESANLAGAHLQSAEWAGATVTASAAHSADLTGGKNLTQSQLAQVIGDKRTILPRDAQTGEWLHVWSCWDEAAAVTIIEIWTAQTELTPENMRQGLIKGGWLCGPDSPRRPVGIPAENVVGGYR